MANAAQVLSIPGWGQHVYLQRDGARIDTCAHEGALAVTVSRAVLGTGPMWSIHGAIVRSLAKII